MINDAIVPRSLWGDKFADLHVCQVGH